MELIDKSTLVAEIEKRIKTNKGCMLGLRNLDYYQGKIDALNDTISFLTTFEVKKTNSELLKKHFEETPQKELDKEWKEIEPLNDIGPDVLEYADKIKNG